MKNISNYVTNCDTTNFIETLFVFLTNGKNGNVSIWLEGLHYLGTPVLGHFVCAKTENNKFLAVFDKATTAPIIVISLGAKNHKHTLVTEFPSGNPLNSEEKLYIFDLIISNALTLLNMCNYQVLEEHVAEGR